MDVDADVAIAGGGLAGLVAARHLADAGADVTVYERRDEVGGRVRTHNEDGYTFDRGFQVLFTAYPSVQRELDLGDLSLRRFAPGATMARPGERTTIADPLRAPGDAVETLFNPNVPVRDLVRLFTLRRDLKDQDETDVFAGEDIDIASYLQARGFSQPFVDHFAAPFYGGITLDRSLSTSSSVFEYTFKMLTEGATAVPAAGMGAIPAQLRERAEAAGATVETGAEVTVVAPEGDEAIVDAGGDLRHVDAAIVATDPKTAHDLTDVETPTEPRGCTTVHLSLPSYEQLDTGKRILLNAASERPNTVAPMSAVAPEYAPDDRHLLAATYLGVPDASDEELAAEVTETLQAWYPEHRLEDVELHRVDRVEFAQFAQPPGFLEDRPSARAPDGPIYLAGDYTRWSSIHGAMESGKVAADLVRRDL